MERGSLWAARRRALALALAVLLLAGGLLLPAQALAAAKRYTVKFNANGGTGAMPAQTIAVNKSVKLKAVAFKRAGYAFASWNTRKDGKGKAYKNQAAVKNLAKAGKAATLYAQWRAYKPYTVTFAANGGAGTMARQSVAYGRAIALAANAFAREDHAFAGWNTKADGTGKAYANKAKVTNLAGEGKAITLYAQWRPTTYLVRFDANGGEGGMGPQKVTAGRIFKLSPCALARAGHRFAGWNTAADGSGNAYDDKDVVIDDLAEAGGAATLYARWEAVPEPPEPAAYEVRFDANGGTGTMAAYVATEGTAFRLKPCSFAREGYAFEGWNTAADGSGDAFRDREAILPGDLAPEGGAVTLHAQWAEVPRPVEPASCTIRFDANGGEGTMEPQVVHAGEVLRLTANAFTHDLCSWDGWSTKPDGSGEVFDDRSIVTTDWIAQGEVTLYAQWYACRCRFIFDPNGGEGESVEQITEPERADRMNLPKPERDGFVLLGWSTDPNSTTLEYGENSDYYLYEYLLDLAAAGETVTLYAVWTPAMQLRLLNPDGTVRDLCTVGRSETIRRYTENADDECYSTINPYWCWTFDPEGNERVHFDYYSDDTGMYYYYTFNDFFPDSDEAVLYCQTIVFKLLNPDGTKVWSYGADRKDTVSGFNIRNETWTFDPEGNDPVQFSNGTHEYTFAELFPNSDEVILYRQDA